MIAIPPADDNFEDHRLTIGQQQWWRANTSKTCLALTSVTGNFDSVSENPHQKVLAINNAGDVVFCNCSVIRQVEMSIFSSCVMLPLSHIKLSRMSMSD